MGMTETETSLRSYFFVAGALAILASCISLVSVMEAANATVAWKAALWVGILRGVGFGAAHIVAGLRLNRDLRTGSKWIRNALLGCVLVGVMDTALTIALVSDDLGARKAAGLFWMLPITGYLLFQLRRLSLAPHPA